MKSLILFISLYSLSAFALSPKVVQECAQSFGATFPLINSNSSFQTSGEKIYKISPNQRWGSLNAALFHSKEQQDHCYMFKNNQIFIKKKTELSSAELKSCNNNKILESHATVSQLDEIFKNSIINLDREMQEFAFGPSAGEPSTKGLAIQVMNRFDKCKVLQPSIVNDEFTKVLREANSSRDGLVRIYKLNSKATQPPKTAVRPAAK
jgi:hypothetical protein